MHNDYQTLSQIGGCPAKTSTNKYNWSALDEYEYVAKSQISRDILFPLFRSTIPLLKCSLANEEV